MVVFTETLGVYGGSLTLLLRMCRWTTSHNINTAIVCIHDDNTEIVQKMKSMGVRIIKADIRDISKARKIFKDLYDVDGSMKVINFGWINYNNIEIIKKKERICFDNLIYCIHPETFYRGNGYKNSLIKKYVRLVFGKQYQKMVNNDAVIMMDEVDTETTEAYLQVHTEKKPPILFLPMECVERDDSESLIQMGINNKILMTASRADFPMKGYMIGLVDDYAVLKKEFPNLKLVIVASGLDRDVLVEKINSSPYKDEITLYGWMDYDRLCKMLESSTVFIGMGTGVLDAAVRYKPAIAVNYNTYGCYADTTIADTPECTDTRDVNCCSPAINIIRRILNYSEADYRNECYKSFYSVKRIYDVDVIMGKMMKHETQKKGNILNSWEILQQTINNRVNIIRTRNYKPFDYSKIYKEPE